MVAWHMATNDETERDWGYIAVVPMVLVVPVRLWAR
jgi:hypothetical protein